MQVVPLDCLLQYTGLPVHTSRTVVQIVVPVMMMLLLMLAFCVMHHLNGNSHDVDWLKRHISITAFSVTSFFYASLSQAALSIFSCFPIDAPIPTDLPYKDLLQASMAPLLLLVLHSLDTCMCCLLVCLTN